MTSTISSHKILGKIMRQTAWLPALISIVSIFVYPIRYLMAMQELESHVWVYAGQTKSDIELMGQEATISILGRGDLVTLAALVVAGILCAVVSFSFLDSKDKVDLYHSLAIRREKIYGIAFLRGWLSGAVPYLFFVLLSFFGIGSLYHMITKDTLAAVGSGIGLHLLAYTTFYAVTALAMILTGRILTGLLMSAFLLCFGPACYVLYWLLLDMRFTTYWGAGPTVTVPIRLLSPLIDVVGLGDTSYGSLPVAIAIFAVWGFLAIVLGVLLYKKRPSEAAENAMMHPLLGSIIKVAVVICGSLLLGIFLLKIAQQNRLAWFAAGVLIGAILLNIVMEFIYTPDLKMVFRNWKSGLAGIGVSVLILGFLLVDPLQYDRWLPSQDEVESMAMIEQDQGSEFGYIYPGSADKMRSHLQTHATTDFAPIYRIAREGVGGVQIQEDDEEWNGGVYYEENGQPVEGEWSELYEARSTAIVFYRLKNGKEVYRKYDVRQTSLLQAEEELCKDPAQAAWIYPVNQIDREKVLGFTAGSWTEGEDGEVFYSDIELGLTRAERNKLLTLLQKETMEQGLSVYGENTVTALSIRWNTKYGEPVGDLYDIHSIYIYPEYKETIRFLEEKGVLLEEPEQEKNE